MRDIKRLIAAERRAAFGYTLRLILDWRASRAERVRWRALRAWHEGQIERWRARL